MAQGALHPFLDHPVPLAIAHRGGALEAEENTEPAFAHAAALGFTHAETDVQASQDGVAVILHDPTLERTTTASGPVDRHDWAALARVRTPGGAGLMRLEDLLEAFPEMFFTLEIKSARAVAPMARALVRLGALGRVSVGAFVPAWVAALRARLAETMGADPGRRLCHSPAHGGVARVYARGWGLPVAPPACDLLQIPPSFRGLPLATARTVRAAHAAGLAVHVWTINDAAAMHRLLDAGVDGIMSDRPGLLRGVLQARGQWRGGPAARTLPDGTAPLPPGPVRPD